MAEFPLDDAGKPDDRVRLELDGAEVTVAESYEVRADILTQPAAWSLRLGHGGVARDLMRLARPNTPFRLFIGRVLQQTGRVDGPTGSDAGGSATEVTITGRDALAPLHDAYVRAEWAQKNGSFRDLVEGALGRTVGDYVLTYSNAANRSLRAGVGIRETAPPATATVAEVEALTPKAIRIAIQAKLGEREYELVKRQLDRAGLFLWSTANGEFVLSEPNPNQPPVARILRRRGQTRSEVTVESAHFQNLATPRFSEIIVYARGGGRKFGRSHTKGSFTDPEMVGWGFDRPLVIKDANVATAAQAEFFARRKIAETIRSGWRLTYTVTGHTAPSLVGGGRVVWSPDTVVQVVDDEYGLSGLFYIEGCTYRGGPQGRTTELHLMRPDSLVFGSAEET